MMNSNNIPYKTSDDCLKGDNRVFKFTLRNYKIESYGMYYLKVYIREVGDNGKWQIQSMNNIMIK